jgi:hypothetical protein
VDNQYPLRWACQGGHVEVVKLLLADPRVDPSAGNQYAIVWATENSHLQVVKLLLDDQRVDVTTVPLLLPSSPEILALFSLRRVFRSNVLENKQQYQYKPDFLSLLVGIEEVESQRKSLLDAHLLVSDVSLICV